MMLAVPWGITAFGLGLMFAARAKAPQRTWIGMLAAAIGFGYWDTVRNDGIWGDFKASLEWRWAPTAEDEFLERLASRPATADGADEQEPLAEAAWPSFRGPNRDSTQPGIALDPDWDAHSPEEVWRVRVGPGWSSFSVAGSRIFTQEQRGEHEAVVCYDAGTGAERWAYQYESRFWEAVAGAGPRATPTLSGGRLYALGAEGVLSSLDPVSGESDWHKSFSSQE